MVNLLPDLHSGINPSQPQEYALYTPPILNFLCIR